MTEESGEHYDLADLLRRGVCPACLSPISQKEPGEGITNGMHNYCCLQQASGHLVDACWCNPETKDLSLREIAILAYTRFKERYG